MDLTLDYNVELFPLQNGQSFALALASSLSRAPQGAAGATEDEDKDRDVWRPDAKGRRGLDDDYEYVMYGKVRVQPQSITVFHPAPVPSSAHVRPVFSCSVFYALFWDAQRLYIGIQIRWRFSRDCVSSRRASRILQDLSLTAMAMQDGVCIVWWSAHVPDGLIQTYDEYCLGRSCVHTSAPVMLRGLLYPVVFLIV